MQFLEKLENSIKMPKRMLKIILTILNVSTFVGLFYPCSAASEAVKVVKITDGEIETIRFKGVDTPETAGYKCAE